GKIERLDAVAGRHRIVAVSLQQIVEELHVELVVLHDHHGLRHCRASEMERLPASAPQPPDLNLGETFPHPPPFAREGIGARYHICVRQQRLTSAIAPTSAETLRKR